MTFPRLLILALALALAAPAAAHAATPKRLLVSLGDSYATGCRLIAELIVKTLPKRARYR